METRKNSLFKTAAISFLLTIFCSASAYAQPNITSFSGSLTNKGTLSITGSGFGTKAQAAPLKWDDFESGTLGTNLGNGWWSTAVGGGPLPKYDNTVLRTGSAKSVLQDYTYPGVGSTGGNRQYGNAFGLVNQNNNKYYISFWRYLTTAGSPVRNFKTLSLRGGTPGAWDNPEARMDTYAIYGPTYGYFYTSDCSGATSASKDGQYFSHATGVWMRLEFYIDTGTIGGTDGIFWHARDGVERVRLSNQVMRTSSCAFSNLYINGYFSRETNDNDASAYIWNDDVYIDTTQARVEIGNAPTWGASTHREIQIPSAWSDTSITITMNQGSFSNLSNAYLYVIDANGDVNTNGYLLSDSGGNISPPTDGGGGNSGGDASASGGSGCGFVKDDDKGLRAKGEGVALIIMLIITLLGLVLFRIAFKRRTLTSKAGGKSLKFKSGLIVLTLLFLFIAYNPAHATIYLNLNAEEGTVGTTVPNPPFCQTPCSGGGALATYQSNGGTPQGTKYYQWQTVNNQNNHYTAIVLNNSIANIIGKTYYLAYYFRFDRINGLDIWHEFNDQSYDKLTDIMGNGVRWTFKVGQHQAPCYTIQNQDHRFTVGIGNSGYSFSGLECVDQLIQNSNGYSASNPIQLTYETWHSVVIAIKMAADNTGSVTLYINGIKILEYNNIRTVLDNSSTLTDLRMGGTLAQPAYDAPANYRKFDAILLTDNWQDIIDGGYVNADTQAPTVPTGLSATAVSSSQINLSWTGSTDNFEVTGYRIYRDNIEIATSTTTSYSNTGLSPSTTYSYTVSAYDTADNNSNQSSSASATTQAGGGGSDSGSSGDASASGGSGCGFVKDDGSATGAKEQGAKAIGLEFVLLLVITIRTLFLIKKFLLNIVY